MAKKTSKRTSIASDKAPAQLAARVADLQKRIRSWGADALLVTNDKDIRYLTGFVGHDSWALIRAKAAQPAVLSDFRFDEQIQKEAPHVLAVMRKQSLSDELLKLKDKFKLTTIAVQADYMTLAQRKAVAKKVGTRTLKDVSDDLIKQRAVKTVDEVAEICNALAIQEKAFQRTIEQLKPGQSEIEVAAFLEYQMRSLGADGPSFPSIVAVGANGSLPHAIPGLTKVKKNDIVLIDWGAVHHGYCSDLTRVVALGKMPAKMREVYQVVLDAQMAAIDAIAPGKSLKEIDKVARDIIDKAGYGERFGHSLGHGIGLDIHEQPTLSPRSEGVLEPGHVVTAEPGIYLPGVGGVRIEDDVLVTETGGRVLSNLPKTLDSAII